MRDLCPPLFRAADIAGYLPPLLGPPISPDTRALFLGCQKCQDLYTPSRDPCPGLHRRACALYGLSGKYCPRPAGSTPGLSFSRHVRPTQGPRPCRFPPFHVHLLRLWETAHFEISAFFIASIMSEYFAILYKYPALWVPPMLFQWSLIICLSAFQIPKIPAPSF